jgi:hypothetical protein
MLPQGSCLHITILIRRLRFSKQPVYPQRFMIAVSIAKKNSKSATLHIVNSVLFEIHGPEFPIPGPKRLHGSEEASRVLRADLPQNEQLVLRDPRTG